MSIRRRSSIIDGCVISVDRRAPSSVAGKCRGYGRGVSRNATASGPLGGFIGGAPIEVGGGQSAGSPGCPWVVDALPGQRINFTLMDFFERRRTTNIDVSDDSYALRTPGKPHLVEM